MGRYLQTNAGDYYKEPEPPKTRIPHSPEEFEQMSYKERLKLRQTNEKIYNMFAGRKGRLQSWEHR